MKYLALLTSMLIATSLTFAAEREASGLRESHQQFTEAVRLEDWPKTASMLFLPTDPAHSHSVKSKFEANVKLQQSGSVQLVQEVVKTVTTEQFEGFTIATLSVEKQYRHPLHSEYVRTEEITFAVTPRGKAEWKFAAGSCLTRDTLLSLISSWGAAGSSAASSLKATPAMRSEWVMKTCCAESMNRHGLELPPGS